VKTQSLCFVVAPSRHVDERRRLLSTESLLVERKYRTATLPSCNTALSVHFTHSYTALTASFQMNLYLWPVTALILWQIGIFDDHDGCEWVNVSSGTGSPGLSRTKSTEP